MTGSLICVGLGMMLGAHISPISRSHIEQADIVFSLASNGVIEKWVEQMNSNVVSLQSHYQEGKSRNITYQEMIDKILNEVRKGRKVVGAFYGHPGVFAYVPHKAIELAQREGYVAAMEPGISAEDCLFADLAIDPGKYGYQQYEASQFMFYQRTVDPSAYLVLWQVGVAGDRTLKKHATNKGYRKVLVDLLTQIYPASHKVILYQAKVLPTDILRKDEISLRDMVNAELFMHTTLVIPPSKKMILNNTILTQLEKLEEEQNYVPHLKVIK